MTHARRLIRAGSVGHADCRNRTDSVGSAHPIDPTAPVQGTDAPGRGTHHVRPPRRRRPDAAPPHRRPGRPARAAAVLAALVLGLTGCGIVDSEGDRRQDELDGARERWATAGLTDYTYLLRQLCFCGFGGQLIRVQVVDGAVAGGTLVDTGEAIPPEHWAFTVLTVDDLFERIQQILDGDPHQFSAAYHDQLGYPTSVSADPIENAVDEEWGVEVSGVVSSVVTR